MVSQRVKNMLPGIERNVIEYKKVLSKSQILNKEPLNKTKAKKARKKI